MWNKERILIRSCHFIPVKAGIPNYCNNCAFYFFLYFQIMQQRAGKCDFFYHLLFVKHQNPIMLYNALLKGLSHWGIKELVSLPLRLMRSIYHLVAAQAQLWQSSLRLVAVDEWGGWGPHRKHWCVCVCGPQRVLPPGSSCNPSSSAARFEAAETLLCPPTQGERILFPYTAQM